jgi:[ribosomal protein S5]-alanine N-acetyltransferase
MNDIVTSGLYPMFSLETPRLILRRAKGADVDPIFAWAKDPEVTRYGGWDAHKNLSDTQEFVDNCFKQYAEFGLGPWIIERRDNGRVVGTCGFGEVNRAHRYAAMGYFLARDEWGQGFGTEAARAVLNFGLGPLGMQRVEAHCAVENTASEKVLTKIGMHFEALLRARMYKNGKSLDVKIYAKLRGEG